MFRLHVFEIGDGLPTTVKASVSSDLHISATSTEELVLFRLLLGTATLKHSPSDSRIDFKVNYSNIPFTTVRKIAKKQIVDFCKPDFSITDLADYFKHNKFSNRNFFKYLLIETCYFSYHTSRQSHTTAFIHLYRMLESISYSFPLFFAAISKNYIGTYEKLKKFFSDNNRSELKFFDEFINVLLDGDPSPDITLDFNILEPDPNLRKMYFDSLTKILSTERIYRSNPHAQITIQYKHVFSLLIELRNRFFHFLTGDSRNLKSDEIIESDNFFKIVNADIMNWISYIYFKILKHRMSELL